tara:strand:- start:17542 stop:18504 length:963 start_codon:yes stop_codon:yes gene_type:complete
MIARHLEPKLTVSPKSATLTRAKELINFSGWTLIIDACRLLQDRADIWIIGAFLSAQVLTLYYVGLRLATYTFELMVKAVSMNMPLFVRDFSDGNTEGMQQKLFLFTRLNFLIATLAISAFIVTGRDIIALWMGDSFDVVQAYQVALLLLASKMILFISMPINAVFIASYKPKIMSWIGIYESIAMLLLLLFFVRVIETGITGAATAMFISYALLRPTILPIMVARELRFRTILYFKAVLPLVVMGACVGGTTFFIGERSFNNLDLHFRLSLKIAVFVAVSILLIPLVLRSAEKFVLTEALGKFAIIFRWPDELKILFKK